MFKRILNTYLIVFAVFFLCYSFLNWLLTTKTRLLKIDEDYSDFWVPIIIIYIPVYFILWPLLKNSSFKSNIKEGLVWAVFPFSIGIPTAFSQQFFKDISYQVINIDRPDEIGLHSNERFFKIKTYYVSSNDFSLYKERHVSGVRSKSLKVNNYYIATMYSDTVNQAFKVAYGVKYTASLNYGLLVRDEAKQKTREFNIESANEFSNYDFYNITFFERQMNSEDEVNFHAAWRNNNILKDSNDPIVLVPKNESFVKMLSRGRKVTIFSIIISLTLTIGLLYIFNHYRMKPNS
ncbi:MAG: hypothetical protein KA968_07420 [Chitinophagaceae bacterium]|nr:hypothetical protein [Chitinophagaceae bacterium]MBP7107296.1 hypothetical protein [Chitinophagaceae bacterium]MBP7315033.1 hypothetical protein [Chitinophagaceae bacterium]HQX96375.1 hypothetical protein [Chitinophagaceae bacterium]HQZ50096.1 hypothetical protein [Chitinophagaceae bacterium]